MSKIFEGSFSETERALFKELFVRLGAILRASQNVLADALEPAAPDSPNRRAREAQVWDAYEQVGPLMYSAEDHLRTIHMLFEGPRLPTYALYTLARAAGEAIVLCAYLVDPDIDERARMARGLNVRLVSLIEQTKMTRDAAAFGKRVGHLEQRATDNGITVIKPDLKMATWSFGEQRKRDTTLFGVYIKARRPHPASDPPFGESMYRYLSAHAHSTVWVKLADAETFETKEPGMATAKLDLKFEWLATILNLLLDAHERSIYSLLRLSGYPALTWQEAMKTATADMKRHYVELAEGQARAGVGGTTSNA